MAKTKIDVDEEVTEVTPKASKASKNEATVTWAGNRTRTYTRELHGDKFADLAKEFATKNNGAVS